MAIIEKLDENTLEEICNLVADTSSGLTGREIETLLGRHGIEDISPLSNKRQRLFLALQLKQDKDNCANNIFAFIQTAIDPVRYTSQPAIFHERKDKLNIILALRGFTIGNDGKVRLVNKVSTLSEAQEKASRLRKVLSDRNVHSEVLKYCKPEFLDGNYFHAVFEAIKGVGERIRTLSGLTEDGAELIDKALNINTPILAINSLQTETERSEHKGFCNLLKGMFGMFRNVTAHAPKVIWHISEQDAFDILTFASFVHRKLDNAIKVPRRTNQS
jgi:uncharacterized protein (TIGR02391 family)